MRIFFLKKKLLKKINFKNKNINFFIILIKLDIALELKNVLTFK